MKTFYHTDMDGHCSGAIVYKYFKGSGEYISINYNQEFPFDTITKDEDIVIVDFSLQKEGDFEKLLEITNNVIWIDHHKTAIEKHSKISDKIEGVRTDGIAGCVLTWKYFYPEGVCPVVVTLLGDYDIWAFNYGENTKHLQSGIRLYDTRPESESWEDWLDIDYFPHVEIDAGVIATKYRDNGYKGLVKGFSYYAYFEGWKAICCNAGSVSSQLFDSVPEENYDIMLTYIHNGFNYSVSIYTKNSKIDVSEIAKKYGGGGHKGAAGFTCDQLPFYADKFINGR
jgi:oligoribonuclease NrnB/cAMP/cGMP phosphodiesterase (DHH superfamily)